MVDRGEYRQSLLGFLTLREAVFLVDRLADCGVTTKRDLLVMGLFHILDDEHKELIRVAMGLQPGQRNVRIFSYMLRDLVVQDVKRCEIGLANGALSLLTRFNDAHK